MIIIQHVSADFNEKASLEPLVSVIKRRLKGEKDVSIRKHLKEMLKRVSD